MPRPLSPQRRLAGLALTAVLALAGCAPEIPPGAAPAPAPVRPAAVAPPAPSAASAAAQAHYARVQAQLLAQGLLRTDGGGPDTPYSDRMLADTFIRIALYDEYARGPRGPEQRQTASQLRRWEQPVRVALRFGPSVPPERQATDRARVGSYLGRLSAVTGHPIRLDESDPNFFLYIVAEDERRALGPTVAAILPGLSPAELRGITDMPLSTYCLVYALSSGGRYSRAFAVVRAEHPDLMRLSCIHEEVAQGLGLANDSPRARPSIFNDDEEFALLTGMDEKLLKILYDPALRPGMTEAEARPIVDGLAQQLAGSGS